jgi:MinD-like ATPase involved in chromosome partitioning or flagellar assembly
MVKIISVHSFRGGTGKSNTTANLATLLAAQGLRVGVVDTDIQSPGIHILFGLGENEMGHVLNDYLWGNCNIEQAAHDVTSRVGKPLAGRIFLVPSSVKAIDITRILSQSYDVGMLIDGFQRLVQVLALDVLMIDTHPGLGEETLISLTISDTLVVIMRPDQQDFQGTGVTIEVARKLEVPRMLLLINKTPGAINADQLKAEAQRGYDTEVVGVIYHSEEMMALASAGIFAVQYPDHPTTATLRQVANRVIQE